MTRFTTHRARDRRVPRDAGLGDLHRDERGAIAVEYIVVLVLVILAAITAWAEWRQAVEDDAAAEYQTFGYPP